MNQPLFGNDQVQRSKLLADILAKPLPQPETPIAAGANTASKLIGAYAMKKHIGDAMTKPMEGPVPAGQYGPGAPVKPDSQEISKRLFGLSGAPNPWMMF